MSHTFERIARIILGFASLAIAINFFKQPFADLYKAPAIVGVAFGMLMLWTLISGAAKVVMIFIALREEYALALLSQRLSVASLIFWALMVCSLVLAISADDTLGAGEYSDFQSLMSNLFVLGIPAIDVFNYFSPYAKPDK